MHYFLSIIVSFSLVLVSCKKEEEPTHNTGGGGNSNTSETKVMPLGASRVEGDRPNFESYRYELWKTLLDSGYTFDYVGTQEDMASYQDHSGQSFDHDHEGRGGWTSGQILNGLPGWLDNIGNPDIVLFSSPGGNDALIGLPYSNVIDNVNDIIDTLQTRNPNITIIIEQLAPGHSSIMTPTLTTYFNDIRNDVVSIASQQTTATSQVLVVDMATGFQDSFLADNVHYNQSGAVFIATRYYEVLKDLLP